MKVGVLSDTHGSMEAVERAFHAAEDAELWLHAGDCTPDGLYLAKISGKKVIGVAGNCDWPDGKTRDVETIECAGRKIFLTHGHLFRAEYGIERLCAAAKEAGAAIAIYGHTHIVLKEEIDGVLVLNPGSAARPRDEKRASFLTMEFGAEAMPSITVYRL